MDRLILTLGSGEYDKITYPAGELQVRLKEGTIAQVLKSDEVLIIARIVAVAQIVELCLLCDAINAETNPDSKVVLALPYLPFSRADRRFVKGDCFGLQVFSKLLSSLQAKIVTLDAHSAKAKELINGLTDVSALPLISQAIKMFATENSCKSVTVLFPDEGARKRYSLPQLLDDVEVNILHCSKKRDQATGKFIGFTVPERAAFSGSNSQLAPVIIIDDICDGGGTFIGIADALKSFALTLALYVTHGIFSKGLSELEAKFSKIYTTDAFQERQSTDRLQVMPAMSLLTDFASG